MGATVIKSGGQIVPIAPNNYKKFSLQELQGIVGGYLEHYTLQDGQHFFCNEDGKRLGLPVNFNASDILFAHFPNMARGIDFVVGDVLICSKDLVD